MLYHQAVIIPRLCYIIYQYGKHYHEYYIIKRQVEWCLVRSIRRIVIGGIGGRRSLRVLVADNSL